MNREMTSNLSTSSRTRLRFSVIAAAVLPAKSEEGDYQPN